MDPGEPITIVWRATTRDLDEARDAFEHGFGPDGRPVIRGTSASSQAAGWLVFAGMAALAVWLARDAIGRRAAATWAWAADHPWVTAPAGTLILVLAAFWLAVRWWIRRELRSGGSRLTLDADGLLVELDGSSTRTPWSAFAGWFETDHLLVLRRPNQPGGRRHRFVYLPKRVFRSDADLARARSLVAARLPGSTVSPVRGVPPAAAPARP